MVAARATVVIQQMAKLVGACRWHCEGEAPATGTCRPESLAYCSAVTGWAIRHHPRVVVGSNRLATPRECACGSTGSEGQTHFRERRFDRPQNAGNRGIDRPAYATQVSDWCR